jgi:hypothetical protein
MEAFKGIQRGPGVNAKPGARSQNLGPRRERPMGVSLGSEIEWELWD